MIDKLWGYNVNLRQATLGFGGLKIFQCIMNSYFVIKLMIHHKATLSMIDGISIVAIIICACLLIQGARFVN